MTARTHDRPWATLSALVAVIAVLVVPATQDRLAAAAEPVPPVLVAAMPAATAFPGSVLAAAATAPPAGDAVGDGAVSMALTTSPLALRAISWAAVRTTFPTRSCLLFVRIALQAPRRFPTAMSAWAHARYRYRTAIWLIPAGVPVYTKGASGAGHIVLSLGNGLVRSTDWPRVGHVGTVLLTTLLATWHHRYVGWSADLDGVRVWNDGPSGRNRSRSTPHRR
ncbi:MAG TPA: hypothetical protein VIC82_08375 [Candidatus Nanopelagicales bacterium]|jgi:hypothetical protein